MDKPIGVLNTLKQLIYPRKCTLCKTILDTRESGYVCGKCEQYILTEHLCPKCGRPYEMGQERCLFCQNLDLRHIEQVIALFPYKDVCREAVLRWKYKGIRKYAKVYANLFVYEVEILKKINVDGLIPVPLAPSRLRQRGFNQSLDLANEISNITGIPVYDCLKRTKDTKPQSKCSREERLKNVVGSIGLKGNGTTYPELKQVAIIDDIYTTGATVKECMNILLENLRLKNENVVLLIVCIGI